MEESSANRITTEQRTKLASLVSIFETSLGHCGSH